MYLNNKSLCRFFYCIFFTIGFAGYAEIQSYLQYYEGDFSDSDGDGMTDVAERKYGYDPNSADSFPALDFIPSTEDHPVSVSIEPYSFMGLKVIIKSEGLLLKWNDVSSDYGWSKYSLVLKNGERFLYYGGHGRDQAEVNYKNFSLDGTEVLNGYFVESNPVNGEWVDNHPAFQIDLKEFPLKVERFGDPSNKIKFKFVGFSDRQKSQYLEFIQRVIPIINQVMGVPSENFICEFIMNEESSNSWVTLNHGREIHLDDNWNPRLLVHEMIHMWEGKLGFSWSGENREYSEDLSAFAEVAEGIAYKVLHEFVMAYPAHPVARDTAEGGAWNNWTSEAWSYDLYKHQPFTGGGTFWTGDLRTVDHRYSIAGMLIQIILVERPDFIKNMRNDLFDMINQDPEKILTRDEIIDLWHHNLGTINGIDAKKYLNAMPVFNGRKIDQGFYPVLNIKNSSEVDVFSTYALDGYFWWYFIVADDSEVYGTKKISSFDVPSWVKYNYNPSDGYYYVDMNDMPYRIDVETVGEEIVATYSYRSDNSYQDADRIIPNTLGEIRVTNESDIAPEDFAQGLYRYNLVYTDLVDLTEDADADFYFMGEKNLEQDENEYVILIGVDSKFAEKIRVDVADLSFELNVINGCAILRTNEIPFNLETVLELRVSSKEETHLYKRALVHAGNSWGMYRQNLLIIDRDFDGVEDLYETEISEWAITQKYDSYASRYADSGNSSDNGNIAESNQTGEPGGVETDENKDNKDGNSSEEQAVDLGSFWNGSIELGGGWRYLDGFGYFFQPSISEKWIYSYDLGWIYPVLDSKESIWFWNNSLKWCWTKKNLFPHLYLNSTKNWIFWKNEDGLKIYFDFSTGLWVSLD